MKLTPAQQAKVKSLMEDEGQSRAAAVAWVRTFEPATEVKPTATDKHGFLLSPGSHAPVRQFVGIRAPELAALQRSTNPSLKALAKRIEQALADGLARRALRDARDEALRQHLEERRRDPVKAAEDAKRQRELAEMLGGMIR